MKAIAYAQSGGYPADLAHAFAAGAQRHGVRCEVRSAELFDKPHACHVVWTFGLHATGRIFDAYNALALRVVGDLGYWRERACERPERKRHVRIAVNARQPDKHLRLRRHPSDRFDALQLGVDPVRQRGDHILICGHCPETAARVGWRYGEWEMAMAHLVRLVSTRQVVVREKPSCDPLRVEGAMRCTEKSAADAIRKAFAVVCRTGNIGADAILHGVPVFCGDGPGKPYNTLRAEWIDDALPLPDETRAQALADIAYWQWTPEEIERGELWEHLKTESLLLS
jgi:hypothetical protein